MTTEIHDSNPQEPSLSANICECGHDKVVHEDWIGPCKQRGSGGILVCLCMAFHLSQATATIHNSNSCELGLGGEPCEMCQFADAAQARQESKGVAEAVSEAKNRPQGRETPGIGQCCARCDYANAQEREQFQAEHALTEGVIERIHATMAGDCDCPVHQTATGQVEIDPAHAQRILTAMDQDRSFASLTTVAAAIYDVIDAGHWEFYEQLSFGVTQDRANEQRCDFVDTVRARILELQRQPHGMDAGLRVVREDVAEMGRLMKEREGR